MTRRLLFTMLMLISLALAACAPTPTPNMANPASVHCEQNGGRLEIRQDASGGQVGVCIFADGSECEEWAYFRGECQPGEAATAEPTPTQAASGMCRPEVDCPTPTAELASDGWRIYRSAALGYRFDYPADATLEEADDPARSLTVTGPLVNDEHWPVIFVSHPGDREEFRPPEGADLEQWLADHNLTGENRQPNTQIAGATAVHFRHERSPQSYADDRYFFAHAGQLYTIVILHAGDKEDWELYNRFLESFQFEPAD